MAEQLLKAGTPVDFTKTIDRSVLNGRTAIVTGGASGIGLGIVNALLENGAHVTIADLNEEAGNKAVQSLQEAGHKVDFVKTDVTDWDSQVAAFKHAAHTSPTSTVDIVITSAGIEGRLSDLPALKDLSEPPKPSTATLDVNLKGTYYSSILALWYFARSPPNPAKQLLFICSLAGYSAPPYEKLNGDYEASKFGVRGFFHQLHHHMSTHGGARVNMICPTFVDTPLLPPGVLEKVQQGGLKTAVVGDVVEGALRCLCDESVKGRSVVVAGGEVNGGEVGSANFDIQDEVVNYFGGKVMLENVGRLLDVPTPSL